MSQLLWWNKKKYVVFFISPWKFCVLWTMKQCMKYFKYKTPLIFSLNKLTPECTKHQQMIGESCSMLHRSCFLGDHHKWWHHAGSRLLAETTEGSWGDFIGWGNFVHGGFYLGGILYRGDFVQRGFCRYTEISVLW